VAEEGQDGANNGRKIIVVRFLFVIL